ncbi:hypothetical protein BJ165DRAFT_1474934 [Panaeolus papilionaceus]|nr:hypothetical protein BJ165DRAFT_1474934 [Panaeolus papilionaceus]
MDSTREFAPLQITEPVPPTSTVVVSTRKWKMVYGFISLFGCIESFLTTFAVGYGGFASLGQLIGNLIAFWAFVTWIWTIVLLSFIMRPPRPEPQFWRRRKPHFVWFTGSGAVWGGLTAAFISQLPRQCRESKVSGCILGSISSAIGAVIFGLCESSDHQLFSICFFCFGRH